MSQTEVQLIKDAVIVNADISNSAAIDVSKISGAMPSAGGSFTDDVTFTGASANIVFEQAGASSGTSAGCGFKIFTKDTTIGPGSAPTGPLSRSPLQTPPAGAAGARSSRC